MQNNKIFKCRKKLEMNSKMVQLTYRKDMSKIGFNAFRGIVQLHVTFTNGQLDSRRETREE